MNTKLSKGDRTEFVSRPEGEGTSLLQIEYEGHTYTEGDLVEFDYEGTGHHAGVKLIAKFLSLGVAALGKAGGGWADNPTVLSREGDLMDGITNLRPVKEFNAADLKEGGIITLRLPVDNITITGPLECVNGHLLVGTYFVTNWHGDELLDYREIIDYTPPKESESEWDRPEVFAVMDGDGELWVRGSDGWQCIVADCYGVLTSQELAEYSPITVHAVLAEEV